MNARLWINGLRPKTLPASVAPVCMGACAGLVLASRIPNQCANEARAMRQACQHEAGLGGAQMWIVFALCALLALFMQVAANFANDYSDGIRGADSKRGQDETISGKPQRLVAAGVTPGRVLLAAVASAALAAICGLMAIAITGHWWLMAVGLCCFLAGWFYTGGKHPYGYAGLGEVGVFIFFGLVATLGTEYLLVDSISMDGVLAACCTGLNSVGLLMLNNYRDIDSDRQAGKRTFATMVGHGGARLSIYLVYGISLVISIIAFAPRFWHLGLISVPAVIIVSPLAGVFVMTCRKLAHGDLSDAFALSGKAALLAAFCWSIGLLLVLL